MSFDFQEKSYTWKHNKNCCNGNFKYPTDFGLCCVFVPHVFMEALNINLENFQHFNDLLFSVDATAKNGEKNGLDIVLNLEQFNHAGLIPRGEGFKIALHHHLDKPIIEFSSDLLHPGTETQVLYKSLHFK